MNEHAAHSEQKNSAGGGKMSVGLMIGLSIIALGGLKACQTMQTTQSKVKPAAVSGQAVSKAEVASGGCPSFTEGKEGIVCEVDTEGSGQIPVFAATDAHICMAGDFGTDRVKAWYIDGDGHETLWSGSDVDKAAAKAFWRFAATHGTARVSYSVLPASGTCP